MQSITYLKNHFKKQIHLEVKNILVLQYSNNFQEEADNHALQILRLNY